MVLTADHAHRPAVASLACAMTTLGVDEPPAATEAAVAPALRLRPIRGRNQWRYGPRRKLSENSSHAGPTASSRARVGGVVGRGFVLCSRERIG